MGSSSACWTATVLAHDHPQLRMFIPTALPRAGAHLPAVVGTASPPLPTAVATSRAGVSHRFVHNRCGQPRLRAAAQEPARLARPPSSHRYGTVTRYALRNIHLSAIVFESGCSLGCHGEWTAELHRAHGGGRACRAPR